MIFRINSIKHIIEFFIYIIYIFTFLTYVLKSSKILYGFITGEVDDFSVKNVFSLTKISIAPISSPLVNEYPPQ